MGLGENTYFRCESFTLHQYATPMNFFSFPCTFALAGTLLLGGCNGSTQTNKTDAPQPPREAKGGRYYGGVFRLNESEYIKNLFPCSRV